MNPAELFRQDSDTLTLIAGEHLFRVGETGREMFVLIEGTLDILIGERVVETAHAGALLGEMAMIEEAPRTASVIAKTDCKLARINQRRFQFLVQQNPFFAIHVMQVLVGRLRHMNEKMVQM